ncbi:cytochrome c oxidase subunit 5B, mitochondrial [Folsomia candida]|uniref:Cytochrome c oxidase subunit 5B, mitochondrial n=1 Tax=Folsomia candida TaxID=158441 RepID=A0A226F2Y6_FOLCA|nr:cytochrome c oxidase subunit 5B, mitochondrial [Folsomia candida]OXA63807.1 Cytochrome c oxidase subunit 5B, mitochondrial [Folsomia candida]
MAGVIARTAATLARARPPFAASSLHTSSVRAADKLMPDPLDHATGLERKELEAIARGNDDPFMMKVLKRAAGTKDQPTLIPSFHAERLVGCVCHEDAFYINYMWLYKGEPKRCECGYWFKLTKAEDPFKFK